MRSRKPKEGRLLIEAARELFPTPCAMEPAKDLEHYQAKLDQPRSVRGGGHGPNLATYTKMFPTPVANDALKTGNIDPTNPRNGLSGAVRKWATPTAQDSKNSTLPQSQIIRDSIPGQLLRDGIESGSLLNPDFEEWLMGWPKHWTSIQPLPRAQWNDWLEHFGPQIRRRTVIDWWPEDPQTPRVTIGIPNRNDRVRAIGNGQVPMAAAAAFLELLERIKAR